MKKQNFILLGLLFFSSILLSQRPLFGVSFCGGYKSNYQEQGVFFNTRLIDRVDINFGYSRGKFNGLGFSGGARCLFFNKKFQPFIGCSYSKNYGNTLNTKYQNLEAKYKISVNDFVYADGGVCFKYIPNAPENNFDFIFVLAASINYRYSLNSFTVSYVDGDYSDHAKSSIEKRVGNGIGGQFSIGFLVGKKTKK
jgi:hypothetical protein